MSNDSRREILTALRRALADHPPAAPRPAPKRPAPPEAAAGPLAALEAELEAISARLHVAESKDEAQAAVRSVIREHQVKRVALWADPLLASLELDELLAAEGVEAVRPDGTEPGAVRDVAGCDLGITSCQLVIVESGTLMVSAGPETMRSVSLSPPVHLAVATPAHLTASLDGLVVRLEALLARDGRLPSAVHLITGPSRTGDIELTLTLGVHGPKAVHVLVLDH